MLASEHLRNDEISDSSAYSVFGSLWESYNGSVTDARNWSVPLVINMASLVPNTSATSVLDTGNGSDSIGATPPVVEASDANEFFNFVTSGVLITVMGVMGLAGNALSIVVLSRPQMRSSINFCLIGLATFDSLVLVTSMLMFGFHHLCEYLATCADYNAIVFPYVTPFVFPLGMIAQTGSVWVTVTVTIERYVAVCLPLRAKSLCTYGRARVYITVIAAFSVVYNLPRFWEVERVTAFNNVTNLTEITVEPSSLRYNVNYVNVYITWMYLFVMYLVPFVLLAVLNGIIWLKVRQANRARQQLSRLQQKEMSLAIMLFCVVVVFFMCNILALLINILELFDFMREELTVTSNLLVTINSSVNFVIYCIFGQKFRRILLRTVCRCCPDRLRRSPLSRGGELEESCVYQASSVNTAETKPLMHYNGNGSVSVRLSHTTTTMTLSSVLPNSSSAAVLKPVGSNSSLASSYTMVVTKAVPSSESGGNNNACRRSYSRRPFAARVEVPY